MSLDKLNEALKGGKGSGFHGHSGVKGKRGGSAPGKGGGSGYSDVSELAGALGLQKTSLGYSGMTNYGMAYSLNQNQHNSNVSLSLYGQPKPSGNPIKSKDLKRYGGEFPPETVDFVKAVTNAPSLSVVTRVIGLPPGGGFTKDPESYY